MSVSLSFKVLEPLCGILLTSLVTDPNYMQVMEYQATGVPLSKPAEVNLRNNHAQYIFTW